MSTDSPRTGSVPAEAGAATPRAAAAFAAGIVYMWAEALFRLLGTYTGLPAVYRLWHARDGYITAMWLTMSVVALVAFVVLGSRWRNRPQVGSIRVWTAWLIVSAIVAPLIGEIGTPIGI